MSDNLRNHVLKSFLFSWHKIDEYHQTPLLYQQICHPCQCPVLYGTFPSSMTMFSITLIWNLIAKRNRISLTKTVSRHPIIQNNVILPILKTNYQLLRNKYIHDQQKNHSITRVNIALTGIPTNSLWLLSVRWTAPNISLAKTTIYLLIFDFHYTSEFQLYLCAPKFALHQSRIFIQIMSCFFYLPYFNLSFTPHPCAYLLIISSFTFLTVDTKYMPVQNCLSHHFK